MKKTLLAILVLAAASRAGAVTIFQENFESGGLTQWPTKITESGNTLTVEPVAASEGGQGLRVRTGGTNDDNHMTAPIPPSKQFYLRFKIRFLNDLEVDASAKSIAVLRNIGVSVNTKNDYVNRFFLRVPGGLVNTGVSFVTNRWYCVELYGLVHDTRGEAALWLDGVKIAEKVGLDTGVDPIASLQMGADGPNDLMEYHIDDIVVTDANKIGCGAPPPAQGPARSGGTPSGLLTNETSSATLGLQTDVNATCKFAAAPGVAFDAMPNAFSGAGGRTHSAGVSTPIGQDFEFYVRCRDAATGLANADDYRIAFRNAVIRTEAKPIALVPTFASIGVYAPFAGDENANNAAFLEWRRAGESQWKPGMAMTPDRRLTVTTQDSGNPVSNPHVFQWRASVLGLAANTDYDVRVTFSDPDGLKTGSVFTASVKTWDDDPPLGTGPALYVSPSGNDAAAGTLAAPFKTIQKAVNTAAAGSTIYVRGGTYKEQVTVNKSGAPGNLITVLPFGNETVTVDGENVRDYNFFLTGARFVRISGLTLTSVLKQNVHINAQSTDIVVEKCLFRRFAVSGLFAGGGSSDAGITARVVVQNNDFLRDVDGQTHIINFWRNAGNHVIRGNIIRDTTGLPRRDGHYWDGIGGGSNFTIDGFVHRDSDIYDNLIEGMTDDGIESEGGNMNVRIWNNTIRGKGSLVAGMAVAPVILGPLYVFRNTIENVNGYAVKQGQGSTGHQYFYHNTFVTRSDADGSGGFSQTNVGLFNVVAHNNILHVSRYITEYTSPGANATMDFDYNYMYTTDPTRFVKWEDFKHLSLAAFRTATGQEINGVFADPLGAFVDADAGNLRLKAGSAPIDNGQVLLGFNDVNSAWPFVGSRPDVGAYEFGTGGPGDATPPVLSNIAVATPTVLGAAVTWTTNEPATGRVEYGPTTAYGSVGVTTLGTSHAAPLAGLQPGVLYHYRVRATDAAGNAALSGDRTFTTVMPSEKPGDINGDGFVTVIDLSMLLGKWGSADAACDIMPNGVVDLADLSRLLGNWDTVAPSAQAFGAPAPRTRGSAAFVLSPRARRAMSDPLVVDVFLDAPRPVNAVQAALSFPADRLTLTAIETADSAFAIKAQESAAPGTLLMARASQTPLSGRLKVARLVFESGGSESAVLSFARNSMALSAADASDMAAAAESLSLSARPASATFLTPVPADGVNDAVVFGDDVAAVIITDVTGRRVYAGEGQGGAAVRWDGRDNAGRLVPSGGYIAKMKKADGTVAYQSLVVAK